MKRKSKFYEEFDKIVAREMKRGCGLTYAYAYAYGFIAGKIAVKRSMARKNKVVKQDVSVILEGCECDFCAYTRTKTVTK